MKQVVAFGDSNTRYYFGDTGRCGPISQAWPARLEVLLGERGVDARVKNQGYPGEQADFAVAEFARRVGAADLCVLGFGTNDVKKPEVTLALYLAQMSQVLDQAVAWGVAAIVLGIPWFHPDFSGREMWERIPQWNQALEALCHQAGVPFVETYDRFLDQPERWFNERESPKRHYSAQAQLRLAQVILPHALDALE